jgi:hypothetical protein
MKPSKTKFDPKKISGVYPLFGLLLAVLETVLGFWLYKSENPVERSIAGVLMTAVFVAVIYAVVRIEGLKHAPMLQAAGLQGEITPAKTEAAPEEIRSPESELLSALDGSYLINRPPDDWIVEDSTMSEWIIRSLGIRSGVAKDARLPGGEQDSEVMVREFRSPRVVSIIPQPGKTTIDGRLYPSAMEILGPTRLSIIPLDRAGQPPLFIPRSLSQNFVALIAPLSSLTTMRSLTSGNLSGSGRKFQQAEFVQHVEAAIVDGHEGRTVDINITVVGIEGTLCDYALMMNYVSSNSNQGALKEDLKTLQDLVNSFRPIKFLQPEKKKEELQRKADDQSAKFIKENGEGVFRLELEITLRRLQSMNPENPKERLRAIEVLKPFEAFADKVGIKNDDLASLWAALHTAERGDALDFVSALKKLFAEIADESSDKPGLSAMPSLGGGSSTT